MAGRRGLFPVADLRYLPHMADQPKPYPSVDLNTPPYCQFYVSFYAHGMSIICPLYVHCTCIVCPSHDQYMSTISPLDVHYMSNCMPTTCPVYVFYRSLTYTLCVPIRCPLYDHHVSIIGQFYDNAMSIIFLLHAQCISITCPLYVHYMPLARPL